jgi:predicted pyridoxine 5'-phosphate oxidase superfamily flavin-nucleotide-binding protein
MPHRYHEIAFTPAVKAEQEAHGSRRSYARFEGGPERGGVVGPAEAAFLAERDSLYMATVTETGWPYVQHRGGPSGFLKVLDETTVGFADFAGNRQYVSVGSLTRDDRVALFAMDYASRRRLKLFGRARTTDLAGDPKLAAALVRRGLRGGGGARYADHGGSR